MNELKKIAIKAIDEKAEVFTGISDTVWALAELSLKEFKSAQAYCEVLPQLGFTVEKNLCGIETAFSGSFGSGRPVIGILAEYDALSGLSQKAGSVIREEEEKGGNGHGCGHNMLGAGALAAAYGIKCYLEQSGKPGTVIFYGCPGEEGGAAKAYFAKLGLWKQLDCALTWHPDDVNEVETGTCNSCIQTLYKFHGVASHAAGDPEDGRSALDAVELMNVGIQYLREHVKSDARIHYAMINGGGFSPNVVQRDASVLYMVRSIKVRDVNALQARVNKIAEAAAMMTETEVERIFIDACSNTVPNHTLERICYDNLTEVGVPSYTEEEWAYAEAIKATYPPRGLPGNAAAADPEAAKLVNQLSDGGNRAINDFVAPLYQGFRFSAGSTDVGDVSWQTPAVQVHTASFISGAPGHSWQNVSCGCSSIGHKGLIYAGKVIAAAAIDLFEDPTLLAAARAEFAEATAEGFESPVPDGEIIRPVEL